ncbi:hypothetical protein ACFL6X_05130 [Candidatus Latescibacterota bacterium]
MKRYILTTTLGSTALMVGHLALSLGLCPEHLAPLGSLIQGCLALVVGTALFASGMLGLAEAYERVAGEALDLLGVKQTPEERLEVAAPSDLEERNRTFWRGYQRVATGICLFLAGLLGLTLSLAGMSLTLYMAGVGIGVSALALVTVLLAYGGLRRMRRSHVAVARTAETLAAQPDKMTEGPVIERRRIPAYALFSPRGRYPRAVDHRHAERARPSR